MLSYHDFCDDPLIAVDIETKDPFLREKGTGVYRKDGYIIGVSFSNGEISEYYPLRHPDTTPEEQAKNEEYIRRQLSKNNRKIFANGLYDLDWLVNGEGYKVSGPFEDIQVAEPLLNEYRKSYSLDALSELYLGEHKKFNKPGEYAKEHGWSVSPEGHATSHLWRMPYYVVKEYAEADTRLTWHVFDKQIKNLEDQLLTDIYSMEMELYPLLLQMKRVGVRIDEQKLCRTGIELSDLRHDLQNELNELSGFEINANSSRDIEKLFTKMGLPIAYKEPTENMILKGTFRGNPTFEKRILGRVDNHVAKKILEFRHINTLLTMFVQPYPDLLVDGRLHCQFNPLRSDEYGTVSGRFSSSQPNLQQVSGKDEEEYIHESEILNGLVVRKLFIPEEDCDWLKGDWSQIEYRLIAHYASGEGADTIRQRYKEDPNTDYHAEMSKMTGLEDRKTVKTLNFGAAYGMGWKKMASQYGWNPEEAQSVYEMYHKKVPFVKETSRRVSEKAKRIGFIRTVLNRRAHLVSSDKAYVMFNRLIQGSAADIMKKSMVDAHKAGVFNVLYPHLVVHDEWDCSMPRTKEGREAGLELKRIMETCVPLRVPVIADFEMGKNWGELEDWEGQ
jgi:DNA polymerase I-like protein with 3'-5' exonuclease and polymerase domains